MANKLAGIILTLIGLVLVTRQIMKGIRQERWLRDFNRCDMTVLAFDVEEEKPEDDEGNVTQRYHPTVQYEFELQGGHYVGNRLRPIPEKEDWLFQANKWKKRAPVGATISGYYNPNNPGENYLFPERSTKIWQNTLYGGLFLGPGLLMIAGVPLLELALDLLDLFSD